MRAKRNAQMLDILQQQLGVLLQYRLAEDQRRRWEVRGRAPDEG